MNDTDQTIAGSIRHHLWGAGLFLCVLLVFLFGSAAWMQIAGAVIAPGAIVVETNVKTIKHKEGGIVDEILVRNGDLVEAGDLLLRLDDAVTRANLAIVSKQIDELTATEARLLAERDDKEQIDFPDALARKAHDPEIARILDGQRRLIRARTAGLEGRIRQLEEQINQLGAQIDSLEIQITAKGEEIALIKTELEGLEGLLKEHYVSANRVLAVRRDRTRLSGEHGALMEERARAELAISERRVQILQLKEDARADVLRQLQETRSETARLSEQRVAAEDQLSRMDIRAPRSGYVHQLNIHTKGGFISPAEPILLIVPKEDSLIIETQVAPTDVDQLFTGQEATIRLPGLNQRTTPELKGEVLTVSAETSRDEVTGAAFFTARLKLQPGEEEKVSGNILLPGMPVEALITTDDRTILSYLVKPIQDQIARALREE
ncbi:HlyD family type I secretion periplasmic adaptor subunit [Hoeflea prorocentri]|uniref:Membrane fusion protein (MFP) family protein n=1 Tax=Hoeflea prorocentri TaxID=1922333 RepID=A0A9X3UIT1_9HYPH|nr:HlyD family type I secretion periplasmic adaptor subunit [Hoeflea prorocentri]MCY6379415.1 HlyD family type I secretion periplasmic adaptor subunit [Hoeflea prorocentri]MDA5397216.1 HlyD family type I secretion periplasmic adaptor subunit [Hoeflea prorocentri]